MYRSAIWVVPAEATTPPRGFSSGQGKDNAPRWSPEGARLAFLSDREGGKAQVYVIDIAGGEAHKLTAIPQGAGAPVWSPDGTRLVTVVRTGAENNGDKHQTHETPPARMITTLKYRANGEGFTYDRRRHLSVVDAVTGQTRQLTEGDWDDAQPATCWTKDGSWKSGMVFSATRPRASGSPTSRVLTAPGARRRSAGVQRGSRVGGPPRAP